MNPPIQLTKPTALFFIVLLIACLTLPHGASAVSPAPHGTCPNPWEEVAPMSTDLYGDACTSDGTFIYCGGGYSFSSGTVAVFNRYDPVANSWTSLPDMPQAAALATAVYYPTTNKIYIFGGDEPVSGTNYNITRIYDIASNTWSTGANMPDVRSLAAGGYIPANGKIYIVSGYNTGDVTSAQPNTWQYDPAADSWTDLTGTLPFPHPAGGFAFGVVNNKLYIAGGRDAAKTIIHLTWEFDPVAGTYTAKTDEPPIYQSNVPGSAVALNALWVFGGGLPFSIGGGANKAAAKAAFPWAFVKTLKDRPKIPATDNQTRFYDPSTDTWGAFSNMNEFRSFPGGAAVGGTLVATGGYHGGTTVSSVEAVTACFPTPTPPQCDTGAIQNEGFETGSFAPWVILDQNAAPVVTNTQAHAGTFSGYVGDAPDGFCGFPGVEATGDSSFYQQFTVPAGTSTLSFWHWDCTTDDIFFDWQDAYITDSNGTIVQTIFHMCNDNEFWTNTVVDMTPYAGQTVRVEFLVHEDGFGDVTGMYVDDVQLTVPCGSPTPTATATATPTPTATPSPRSTPTPRPRPTPAPRP